MKATRIAGLISIVALCGGCPGVLEPQNGDDALRAALEATGVGPIAKPTAEPEKVVLGQALFFDKILSGNRNISCSTCHTPLAFTGDGLPLAKGQGGVGVSASREAPLDEHGAPILIPRNSPEVFNRGPFSTMFWDGRVQQHEDGSFTTPAGDALLPGLDSALAAQAMFPVTSADEMRGAPGNNELADIDGEDLPAIWAAIMDRLLAIDEYRALFAAAYPDVPEEELTFVHAANAIGAFEADHWTLDDSPCDRYLGGDDTALSDSVKRGAMLFYGSAGCSECHSGALLTDESFHNRAVPQIGPGKGDGEEGLLDFGRERVTGDRTDRYRFRTPPLRNVAVTGPWMHSGAFATLEAAVRHELDPVSSLMNYDPGQLSDEFAAVYRPEQSEAILRAVDEEEVRAVELSDAEVADLIAFLESLTSPRVGTLTAADTPQRVPSGLPLAD